MSSKVFRGIWYRSRTSKEQTLKDAFDRERGKLIIRDQEIVFENENISLQITNIQKVDFGLQGTDPVNSWIKLTYNESGEKKEAYFADGKLFGYFGFFGGTWRIFRSLDHLVDLPIINDRRHIKNKISLVFLFILILFLLYWRFSDRFL